MKNFLCLFGLLFTAGCAHAADWKMDPSGSKLEFVATFEKTSAPGVFKEFDTKMHFDPEKPEGGRLEVTVKVTSADMSNTDVNKAIRGPEWFDFTRFPQAEFHATDIRRTQANRYLARGTLSLKGMQQAVEVPFAWSASSDAAVMEGELTVKRVTFSIGTGEWAATNVIGADVKIRFKVKLRKAG